MTDGKEWSDQCGQGVHPVGRETPELPIVSTREDPLCVCVCARACVCVCAVCMCVCGGGVGVGVGVGGPSVDKEIL